jgi:hypothetical protein
MKISRLKWYGWRNLETSVKPASRGQSDILKTIANMLNLRHLKEET